MPTTLDDLLVLMATDASFARSVKDRPGDVAARYGVSEEDLATLSAIRVDGRARRPRKLEERLSRSAMVFGTEGLAGADGDSREASSGDGDSDDSDDGTSGGGNSSEDNSRDESSGDESSGDESSGDESSGDESSGDESSDDESSDDESSDDESSDDESSGRDNSGNDDPRERDGRDPIANGQDPEGEGSAGSGVGGGSAEADAAASGSPASAPQGAPAGTDSPGAVRHALAPQDAMPSGGAAEQMAALRGLLAQRDEVAPGAAEREGQPVHSSADGAGGAVAPQAGMQSMGSADQAQALRALVAQQQLSQVSEHGAAVQQTLGAASAGVPSQGIDAGPGGAGGGAPVAPAGMVQAFGGAEQAAAFRALAAHQQQVAAAGGTPGQGIHAGSGGSGGAGGGAPAGMVQAFGSAEQAAAFRALAAHQQQVAAAGGTAGQGIHAGSGGAGGGAPAGMVQAFGSGEQAAALRALAAHQQELSRPSDEHAAMRQQAGASTGGMSIVESLRLQKYLDAHAEAREVLSNVVGRVADANTAITANMQTGGSDAVRADHADLGGLLQVRSAMHTAPELTTVEGEPPGEQDAEPRPVGRALPGPDGLPEPSIGSEPPIHVGSPTEAGLPGLPSAQLRSDLTTILENREGKAPAVVLGELEQLYSENVQREAARLQVDGALNPGLAGPQSGEALGADRTQVVDMGDGTFTTITNRIDGTVVELRPDGTRTEIATGPGGEQTRSEYGQDGEMIEKVTTSADGRSWAITDLIDGGFADVRPLPDAGSIATEISRGADTVVTTYLGAPAQLSITAAGGYVLESIDPDGMSEAVPLDHSDRDNGDGTLTRTLTYPNGRTDVITLVAATGQVTGYESDASWSTRATDEYGSTVVTEMGPDGTGERTYHLADGTIAIYGVEMSDDGTITESRAPIRAVTWNSEAPVEVVVPAPTPESLALSESGPPGSPPDALRGHAGVDLDTPHELPRDHPQHPANVEVGDRHEVMLDHGYREARFYGDGHVEVTEAHEDGTVREYAFASRSEWANTVVSQRTHWDTGVGKSVKVTTTEYMDGRVNTHKNGIAPIWDDW